MNLTAESESLAEWLDKVKEEDREALNGYKLGVEETYELIAETMNSCNFLQVVELTQNDLNYSYSSGWNASLEHSIQIIDEYLKLNLIDPKMHNEVISKLEALKLSN